MFIPAPPLQDIAHITHGFFTREGGVSGGIYASLNCGPGSHDDRAAIAKNRNRVQVALGSHALLSLYQVHSPTVVTVSAPWTPAGAPKADAMVTAAPGLALGILTADCAPVLLADTARGVIGAAHAGWKGALGGVCRNVVDAMCSIGARRENISAVVGPCIGQPSYEVGPELRAAFMVQSPDYSRFFRPSTRDGFYMFDLEGFVVSRLEAAGVGKVEALHRDTYADDALFFSYRRTTHRREPDYGRQISAIMLRMR